MTGTKSTFFALVAVLLLPMTANADLIEIVVEPSEGAWFTMTGSFEYDAATQLYSSLTVNITGEIGPFIFNDTACDSCPFGGSGVGLIDPTLTSNFFLSDFSVQWGGGAITAIFRGNSFELDEPNGRLDGTYFLQAATSVPEPGTLALLGIGLFGIALAKRKKV